MRQEHAEKFHGHVVIQITRTTFSKDVIDTNLRTPCKTTSLVDSFRVVGGKPSELEQRYHISSRSLLDREAAAFTREHWPSLTTASAYGELLDSILAATRK